MSEIAEAESSGAFTYVPEVITKETEAATESATEAATEAATETATEASTEAAIDAATEEHDKVVAEVLDSLRDTHIGKESHASPSTTTTSSSPPLVPDTLTTTSLPPASVPPPSTKTPPVEQPSHPVSTTQADDELELDLDNIKIDEDVEVCSIRFSVI